MANKSHKILKAYNKQVYFIINKLKFIKSCTITMMTIMKITVIRLTPGLTMQSIQTFDYMTYDYIK